MEVTMTQFAHTVTMAMASVEVNVDVGGAGNATPHSAAACANHTWGGNCSGDDRMWTAVPHPRASGLPPVQHGQILTPAVIQRIVTLALIMVLTLCGNVVIMTVLTCSRYRNLNRRVNIFIVNLAIGDLTVCCFTMTTEMLFVVFEGAWVLGAVACKVLLYIQVVTLASTTFILTAMSFDRYMAICKPLSFGNTTSRARRMIVVSWTLALVFALPQLLIFKQSAVGIYPEGDIQFKCQSKGYSAWWQRKLYFTFMTSYILILPAGLICFCYFNVVKVVWRQGRDTKDSGVALRRTIKDSKAIPRAKVKTIKMTLSIICSFIMCWTPYFAVHLVHIWSEYSAQIPEEVYAFAETVALLNSALNPILYGCFNIKLKRGLLEVFCPNKLNLRNREQFHDMAPGVSECMTVVRDDGHCTGVGKGRLSALCTSHESSSSSHNHNHSHSHSHSHSSSGPASAPGRAAVSKDVAITEENVNGFRLRVRFANGTRGPQSPLAGALGCGPGEEPNHVVTSAI